MRMPILPARALLQEQLAAAVENEQVHGAMAQVIPMHFRAGFGSDDAIIFIHDRERFSRVVTGIRRDRRAHQIRQRDPLFERYFFRTRLQRRADFCRRCGPVRKEIFEQLSDLFSALGKTVTH